ncbi:MYG1 family protein [Granulibacter bethesdensis]|uniref:MYG1 protein n=1 Tax=Granulibacter bethesdensis (strain ATCC BAA-1260 / CGDNIH1) TaxID=391165 RepID=Q0BQ95_GRABC|nr:MYG1 family protein [Granulibacter bethesdensis]ABI63007.1 MYG1 protein [Granulibacter bethesdensis CGDNIH1]APH52879.1 MYG1 protein [Granulibacter bethesdensis]APH65567.1 MYG1 protein [Granulibacter bethesdensis]
MIKKITPLLITHSGKFHCDEVFAYAVLRFALGLSRSGEDHVLLRTRKPELIETGDIVFDVGLISDPSNNRFDHHQIGAPTREDGTPFSSAGLVWQIYGERAVASLLAPQDAAFAPAIATALDGKLVKRIDEIDNGVSASGPVVRNSLDLAALVGDFNPPWDSPDANGPTAGDDAFQHATAMVAGVLARQVDIQRSKLQAEALVLAAHAAADDKRLLVLETGMPWKNVVFSHDLPVLLAVSPASNGNWMVDTVPPEPGSFAQRLPLPESWAGLQGADLAAVSGVADAVFVHVRRFVGGAKTREGAIALAHKALAQAG